VFDDPVRRKQATSLALRGSVAVCVIAAERARASRRGRSLRTRRLAVSRVTNERITPILRSMDPAVIAALQEYPLPPTLPSIFAERLWLSPKAEGLERKTKRIVASYEEYVQDWSKRLDHARDGSLFQALSNFPSAVPLLERMIEEVEAKAEDRGGGVRRMRKRGRADIKRAFANDPSIGAVFRTAINDLVRIEESMIEQLLDFALWLRGVKAAIDPDARGGLVFDNAGDLGNYLARETA
jgi:hypothetical protein